MKDVYVIGAHTIKFGKYLDKGIKELTAMTAKGVLVEDAPRVVVSMTPDNLTGHEMPEGSRLSMITMWEHEQIPPSWIDKINRARVDHIIVPCSHNYRLFKAAFPNIQVDLVPLGVDVDAFEYRERLPPAPGERMRILWLGAPNPRKGWQVMLQVAKTYEAWSKKTGRDSGLEFYFKTTTADFGDEDEVNETVDKVLEKHSHIKDLLKEEGLTVDEFTERIIKRKGVHMRKFIMGDRGNIRMDVTTMELDELIRLYHSSNVFVYPSYGEGFGLTLAEAMATGCPVVSIK